MEENQQQNQQQFKCTGDCLKCRKSANERREQWQYCAAQFTYNSMRMIDDMQKSLNNMSGEIKELKDKIEAIQNSEANVLCPMDEEKPENLAKPAALGQDNKAQGGNGAPVGSRYSQT